MAGHRPHLHAYRKFSGVCSWRANLYKKTINQWDLSPLDIGRNFIKLNRTTDMTYDGDSDHKDLAVTYNYATSTGNLTYKQEWGEVTGSDDGSFTDTGTDKFGTTYTYAASTSPVTFLSQETVVNSASTTVKDTKFYYDSLSLGSATKGNETKREFWKSGGSWIDTEKTYNTYGLVTQDKDPRDKTTNYTFDSFNLYVATSTNPLSHTTAFQYDYSSGRVATTTDANNLRFVNVYDSLDRVKEIKQPDQTTPTTLVTRPKPNTRVTSRQLARHAIPVNSSRFLLASKIAVDGALTDLQGLPNLRHGEATLI
jgi:hypothetical protein